MPKVFVAVLCDDVRREVGNKFSIMGIFDHFNIGDFTKSLPPFHMFAKLGFEEAGEYKLEVELRSIEGEKRFSAQVTAIIEARDDATELFLANVDLRMGNLSIPRPGIYEFAIRQAGQTITTIPFSAKVRPARLVQ